MSDRYDLVVTGGGTAGHILPLLPVIEIAREYGWRIVYFGSSKQGLEERFAREWSVDFCGIRTGKLRRYFSWENVSDLGSVILGILQALRSLRSKRPHVILSKGGFVSVPVVIAARLLAIPVVAHESDSSLSLSSRIAAALGSVLCTGFPEDCYARSGIRYTGIPIRREFLSRDAEPAATEPDLVNVLAFFGSLGGNSKVQMAVREAAVLLGPSFQVNHIVTAESLQTTADTPVNYTPLPLGFRGFDQYLRRADVVICRAGATTLAELAVLKRRSVVVPLSTRFSRGDQLRNAEFFLEHVGGAVVLLEDGVSSVALADAVRCALTNAVPQGLSEWANAHKGAAQKVFSLLRQYEATKN